MALFKRVSLRRHSELPRRCFECERNSLHSEITDFNPGSCLPFTVCHMNHKLLKRRRMLRAAGVTLSLPVFASLRPVRGALRTSEVRKRIVCIGNMLGFYPDAFWPEVAFEDPDSGMQEHSNFKLGQSTSVLESIARDVTVISGLDHGLKGGHFAIHAFLSGVRQIDAKNLPTGNVTIDQFAAESIPGQTRFPTLTIGSESGIHGGCQLSWTRSGTRVPPISGPQLLFQKLFVGTNEQDKAAELDRFKMKRSILDMVQGNADDLKRQLNPQDKHKLDEYLTAVRDVEKRIDLRRSWVDIPKPEAPFKAPSDRNMVEDLPLLYDLIVLALQTDSTRIATLEIGGDFRPGDLGIKGDYHALSHHGQRKESIDALVTLETYQLEQFARFVQRLSETSDENGALLDQTAVLFGSGMGNANSHTNSNLPIVLAGGGFRHGRLLAFNPKSSKNPPLTNLFLSMLQNFGVETDQFATSTGTLRGLT